MKEKVKQINLKIKQTMLFLKFLCKDSVIDQSTQIDQVNKYFSVDGWYMVKTSIYDLQVNGIFYAAKNLLIYEPGNTRPLF